MSIGTLILCALLVFFLGAWCSFVVICKLVGGYIDHRASDADIEKLIARIYLRRQIYRIAGKR